MHYVFCGALLGAMLRFLTDVVFSFLFSTHSYLLSLFFINAFGCFAFAFTAIITKNKSLRLFWLTGNWGTFTSFSAISALFVSYNLSWILLGLWAAGSVSAWWLSYITGSYCGNRFLALTQNK